MGRNRRIQIICFFLIVILCSACGKKDTNIKETENEHLQTTTSADKVVFPQRYETDSDKVFFACNVIAPETPELTIATAKQAELNQTTLRDYFMEDHRVTETQIQNEDGTSTMVDGKLEGAEKDLKEREYRYEFDDGAGLNVGTSGGHASISFSMPTNYVTDALLLGEEDEGYNGDVYIKEIDFDFASKNQIVSELKKLVEQYSGVNETQQVVYCVDADTLNANRIFSEEEEKGGSATPFTHEDDGYYICMRQQLQGLPVFARGTFFGTDYPDNVPIEAYYTEEGWQEVYIEGYRLYTFDITEEPISLKEFQDIAETVYTYYSSLISDDTYEIYRATLYNYVTEDGTVTPVWIFKTYETFPDGEFRCDQLDINAVTGEVFTIYD